MASIVQTTNLLSDQQEREELRKLLAAILADLTALRTTVAAIVVDVAEQKDHNDKNTADVLATHNAIDTLVAKLNLDGGVTDVDYAGPAALTGAASAALTSAAPSALTVTA
jgi:hypothetical protein